ncbi:unnamed protein product [Timema podura]|uniref:NFX1-type zinc finger-containing protein 1 n=1 Tax=Timema podura TaxID=61482 RepID=A0ABN7P0Q7_TIMPD|nr:unnamed protein product [Timema podura]
MWSLKQFWVELKSKRNAEQGGNGPPNNRNNRDLLNLDVNDAPLFPARRNIVMPRLAPQDSVGAAYGSVINLRRNIGNNGRNAGLNNNTKRGPLQLRRETIQQNNSASHIQNSSQDNAPNSGAVPKRERQNYDRGGVDTERHNSTRSRKDRGSNPRSLDNTQGGHRSNLYTGRVLSVDNIYRSRDSLVGNNGRNSSTGRQGGRFQHGDNFGVGPFQQAPGNHQNYRRNHQRRGQGPGDRGYQYGENSGNQKSRGSSRGGAYKQILGYKRLEELTKQNPEEVITVLANQNSGFYDLLKSDTLRPDLVILLVKALAISCKAEFNALKSSILASTFQEKFLDRLITLIGQLPTDDKRKHCFKYVIGDCLILCKAVMKLLPNNACDSFPRLFMTMNGALEGMKLYQKVNLEKESTHLKELQEQLIIAIEERQTRGLIVSKATELLQHTPPPDNFRELSVFPTSKDIMSLEKPFVRPNIVEGAYTSVEHYLDVQFRLMREDFVKPLREGISEYLNMTNLSKKGHVSSVRIYHKVLFQESMVVRDKIGLMVCFDPDKKMRKINWDHAKRFLFGSLLCFTQDNFQTVLFATVVERDLKRLKEGRIMIEFCEGTHPPNDLRKQEYLMVESEVYFEPYYHVLKALQKMDEDIFPMSEYIVEVQPESYRPKYFTNENVRYNLDGHVFSVLEERAWPRASQLKLDESQFQAFKSALTKEFVVIQGPPGTGKTYLGLKVARALLRNSNSWNQPKTPVLVVCFTNHALDQFLEGLIPVTKNLVRVGRQSKSEVLNEFSLRERKNESRRKGKIQALLQDKKNKQSELLVRIKSIQADIEIITKHIGVVSLSTLKESGLDNEVLENFYKDNKLSGSLFLDWLKSGLDDYRNVDRTADRMLDRLLPPNPVEEATEEENIYNSDMEQDEEVIFDDDIGLDIDVTSILPQVKLVVDFSEMREEAKRMKQEIDELEDTFSNDAALYNRRWVLEAKLAESNLLLEYFSARLKDQLDVFGAQRLVNRKNLWNLTPHERWTLYKHWVSNLKQTLQEESTKLEQVFRTEARILNEAKLLDDLEVMKDVTVIGMTTTGAARLQPLLQALKCKLVIVEEAAEVMESHIIVSLTKYCQHLILIGDHQQLRPTTADFTLARKYYFDISLFERMLKNGMHCELLKVQHRMRPEIAKLIVPTIYPELFNHKSVLGFDNIMGISKNVFFMTHNHYEEKVMHDRSTV